MKLNKAHLFLSLSQVRSMEAALASPSIPPEIVTTLLNLAEFMEHDDKTLPLDARRAWCRRRPPLLEYTLARPVYERSFTFCSSVLSCYDTLQTVSDSFCF